MANARRVEWRYLAGEYSVTGGSAHERKLVLVGSALRDTSRRTWACFWWAAPILRGHASVCDHDVLRCVLVGCAHPTDHASAYVLCRVGTAHQLSGRYTCERHKKLYRYGGKFWLHTSGLVYSGSVHNRFGYLPLLDLNQAVRQMKISIVMGDSDHQFIAAF